VTTVAWCCAGFQSHYESHQAGERGILLLVRRDARRRLEIELLRSVDLAMESTVPSIPIPISLCVDVRIVYCPWCGTNAEVYYEKWAEVLLRPGFRVDLP
jgi:hypothetical protein